MTDANSSKNIAWSRDFTGIENLPTDKPEELRKVKAGNGTVRLVRRIRRVRKGKVSYEQVTIGRIIDNAFMPEADYQASRSREAVLTEVPAAETPAAAQEPQESPEVEGVAMGVAPILLAVAENSGIRSDLTAVFGESLASFILQAAIYINNRAADQESKDRTVMGAWVMPEDVTTSALIWIGADAGSIRRYFDARKARAAKAPVWQQCFVRVPWINDDDSFGCSLLLSGDRHDVLDFRLTGAAGNLRILAGWLAAAQKTGRHLVARIPAEAEWAQKRFIENRAAIEDIRSTCPGNRAVSMCSLPVKLDEKEAPAAWLHVCTERSRAAAVQAKFLDGLDRYVLARKRGIEVSKAERKLYERFLIDTAKGFGYDWEKLGECLAPMGSDLLVSSWKCPPAEVFDRAPALNAVSERLWGDGGRPEKDPFRAIDGNTLLARALICSVALSLTGELDWRYRSHSCVADD